MTVVLFEVKGRPVPWKRLRTNGKTRFPEQGQVAAKDAIRWAFKEASQGVAFCDPKPAVSMTVHAVFKLPERLPKGDPRRMGSPHIMTPDGDNLAKLVKDALNGIAYEDDCQVSTITVKKQWSDHDRTSVTLEYHPVDRIGGAA